MKYLFVFSLSIQIERYLNYVINSRKKLRRELIITTTAKKNSSRIELGNQRIISAESKLQAGWVNALPCRSLGLKLTDVHLRISIALRLGLPICGPLNCKSSQPVDMFGTHRLWCRSAGRIQRHAMINDIIKRALGSANIPSVLEPQGLLRQTTRDQMD